MRDIKETIKKNLARQGRERWKEVRNTMKPALSYERILPSRDLVPSTKPIPPSLEKFARVNSSFRCLIEKYWLCHSSRRLGHKTGIRLEIPIVTLNHRSSLSSARQTSLVHCNAFLVTTEESS